MCGRSAVFGDKIYRPYGDGEQLTPEEARWLMRRRAGAREMATRVAPRPVDDERVVWFATNDNFGTAAVPEAERVGGVSVQLDIAVTRRRWFWWRFGLSLVARRLH